jgi:hypothetical protein
LGDGGGPPPSHQGHHPVPPAPEPKSTSDRLIWAPGHRIRVLPRNAARGLPIWALEHVDRPPDTTTQPPKPDRPATTARPPPATAPQSGASAHRPAQLLLGASSGRVRIGPRLSVALPRAVGSERRPSEATARFFLDREPGRVSTTALIASHHATVPVRPAASRRPSVYISGGPNPLARSIDTSPSRFTRPQSAAAPRPRDNPRL